MRRKPFRRLALIALTAVTVLSSGFGFVSGQASAANADGPLTVAEAIANNTGTATVEGYVVGHATGSLTANFNAPFSNDYNFLIADAPSETDKAKMLDVQISAGYRAQFGLQTNPSLIGAKVKVAGSLAAYNTFPGLKSPTAMSLLEESQPGDPGTGDPGTGDPGTGVSPLPDGTGKKVLFDNTHGETAGAADWVIDGAFSDFADGLRAVGFTVDSLDRPIPYTFGEQAITYDKLKNYDVFVISEPNIPLKKSEQDAMLQYVQGGGSIYFISDHYNSDRNKNRWDGSEAFNGYRRGAWDNPAKGMSAEEAASPAMQGVVSSDWLADNFGVRFRYNALGDVDNLTDVVSPDQSFGITTNVQSVAMHAGSTLAILDPTKAKGLVYVPVNVPAWANAVDQGKYEGGRDEGPFAAIAKVGAGKAAFIGDSSPVEDATPKYLREDTGGKKTTYDGFKGEANDATFLVQTVEWLANHESYTSLDQVSGLQLDTPTTLLSFEDPAQSTEPQPEPWAAPDPGYKWYDPTTFKPGSYGSGQDTPVVTIPGLTTIANARQAADNTVVTVEGVITTTPGSWGAKGFYLQDATGGVYVYQSGSNYQLGQKIKITATKTTYSSEVELSDIIDSTLEGTATVPSPKKVATVDASNQGQVLQLQNVTVANIGSPDGNGTFQFNAVNGAVTTLVRLDGRTGFTYSGFTAKYHEGDTLDITGIGSIFNGTYQLKPRSADDFAVAGSAPDNGLVNVELLGINDWHGKIDQHYDLDINGDGTTDGTYGGAEYLASYIRAKQNANPNAMLVGVGDIIGGSSPVSALFQDEPTVEITNSLHMAVNVVGNHEFDEGTTELLRMVNGGEYPGSNRAYAGMDNDELAANVVWKSGPNAGQPILPAYSVQTIGGQKIGFIGVVTQGAADMVMPSGIQDIEFTDPVAAINKAVGELHAQGIHAIVVLAHSAADQDANGNITGEAANYVGKIDSDVDVIFAAHNHVVDNGLVGNTLIVQASEYGKAFSDVHLTIDPSTGDIVTKSADIDWVDDSTATPDTEVQQILQKYQTEAGPLLNEVEGVAAHDMTGGYGVKGEKGDNALGNLIADSMRAAMNSDFAMVNGGGIRDNLLAGDITYEDLFNILPFNNILEKLEIKGSDLTNIVNAQLSTYYGPDFSISGFKYTWDGKTGKAVNITLPDGSTINPDQTYTITVNNFMATATAAKYKAIGDAGKNPVTGPEDLEALVSFVRSFNGTPIDYQPEGRMSEVNGDGGLPAPTGDVTPIADAVKLADGTSVTLEGIVTLMPGAFGSSKSFYLQDNTGAANIYTATDPGVHVGDKVKLTLTKSTYNGAVEFINISALALEGSVTLTPKTVSTVDASLQYQLVSLKNVKVTQISSPDSYGSFTFQAVNGNQATTVYMDNRTGITFAGFSAKVKDGDLVDITGIVYVYGSNNSVEIKPRSLNDLTLTDNQSPVPEKISIADARQTADGTLVTVEGVITSEPGAFGGQAFYIQDDTAGIYVYQTTAGFHAGDVIRISAKKTAFNTELELSNPVALEKIGTAQVPDPIVQTQLSESNQGRLVTLENVTISNYITATPAGSFEFDASGTHVRIDGRTGISMAAFQAQYPAGSVVNLSGISAIFKGVYQLKPLSMNDVELADSTAPVTTVVANGLTGENQYGNDDVTLTFTATDSGAGVEKTEYSLNGGAWTVAAGPVVISAEGRNVVAYRSTDKAGNVEAEKSIAVWIDKTSPEVVFNGSTVFHPTDSNIGLTASVTDTLSGVKSVSYTLDGAKIDSIAAIAPIKLSAGDHTLAVTAEDNAGNVTTVKATLTSAVDLNTLSALISYGEEQGLFKNHGAAQSLQSKIKNIEKANGSDRANQLNDLAQWIKQHTDKQIDADFAALLLDAVAYLQASK